MPTVSELMLMSGATEDAIWFLRKFGLDVDEDDFEIDKNHKKALNDLRHRRLSPYILAYAWRCKNDGDADGFARFDNLMAIAKIRGFSIPDAFSDVSAKQIECDLLPTAKYWIDRATAAERQVAAFERLALWCKEVLKAGPPFDVGHTYLAVRLLISLPRDEMHDYPKLVQLTLNRLIHHGFLDGWHRKIRNEAGKVENRFFRPVYDL